MFGLSGIKLAIAGGVVALLVVAGGLTAYFYHQHISDVKQTTIDKGTIADQKGTINLQKAGATATDQANNTADSAKQNVDTQTMTFTTNLQKQEDVIAAAPNVQPEVKTKQIATARMQTVWNMFCSINPTDPTCSKPATQKS